MDTYFYVTQTEWSTTSLWQCQESILSPLTYSSPFVYVVDLFRDFMVIGYDPFT